MAGITLAQAESQLALWLAASEAISKSQSYSIAGRSLSRADLAEVNRSIDYWQGWINKLGAPSRGVSRVRYGVVA